MESELLQQLAQKAVTKKQLLEAVESDFKLLPVLISGASSPKAAVRYGCASVLVDLTAKHPEKLYSHMDFFLSLLDSKHRVLKWNGMAGVANLCAVDADTRFGAAFDKSYGSLSDEYMVTVANVVGNSARIAQAKPYLVPRITAELLRVDKISTSPHLTEECKRVIAEHAVKSFDEFFDLVSTKDRATVLSFVQKYADSSRVSLRNEAARFLKKWSS